ncbi:carbonic anhydrase [Dendrothele bispora CBS 962.96]|uniref:Carbonic anhydrase n=1 Tax=Dendrothele bispora (strain CBS 962.96) TaxID=1314807 RepID=A0A4S8KML4_DENBC|nr:carbonic anhydrase [Dendrothele bispora CBS 962.96]
MDSRIYPHEQLGLGVNDTAIIRNAGGAVAEVLTTILACQKFGVRHFMVLKHTDCGGFRLQGREIMEHYKAHAKSNLALSVKAVEEVTSEIREFGYGKTPIEEVVLNDVEFLRKNPLIYEDTVVSGWVFDDETGKIRQVV